MKITKDTYLDMPMTSDCGLSETEIGELAEIHDIIERAIARANGMKRHRAMSLVITKLEEAQLWLVARRISLG